MRGDQYYGTGLRSQKRKRKTADKLLNISIGIVVLLILLVGGQLIFGGKSADPVVSDQFEENEANNTEENDNNIDEELENNGDAEQAENEEQQSASDTGVEEQQSEEASTETDTEQTVAAPQTGEWQPIGTVQEEPFAAVYDRNHVNWEEMTRAFQYATGLGDDMTLWRVGNGGDHVSAVGVVSSNENRNTPYEVRLEWVTNEGWMPVSVVQLEKNPFLP